MLKRILKYYICFLFLASCGNVGNVLPNDYKTIKIHGFNAHPNHINIYEIKADSISMTDLTGYPKECCNHGEVRYWIAYRDIDNIDTKAFLLETVLKTGNRQKEGDRLGELINSIESDKAVFFAGCYFKSIPTGDVSQYKYFIDTTHGKLYEFIDNNKNPSVLDVLDYFQN